MMLVVMIMIMMMMMMIILMMMMMMMMMVMVILWVVAMSLAGDNYAINHICQRATLYQQLLWHPTMAPRW